MPQGSFGKITAFNDFTDAADTVILTGATYVGGGWTLIGVNEGSMTATVDEPGGILAITTDTADNDNQVLVSGPFKPADGGMVMEARFKYSNVDTSIFVGFSETMARDTPVMPAEFATATMTYNGTGGMIGLQYDVDGTTDDFRAVLADNGASLDSSNLHGVRANATVTADRWFVARVEVTPDGKGRCLLGDLSQPELRVVKDYTLPKSGVGALDPTAVFSAVLICENRSANARVLEVDYAFAEGGRDWAAT